MQPPQCLDADAIRRNLNTNYLGRSLMLVDECTSTNDLADAKATEGAPHGFVVIAERQVKGRGRKGRLWFSPDGGIWLTAVIRPQEPQDLNTLPLICALAVSNATNREFKLDSRVRWPNDVILNNRKLAGVLAEARVKGTKFTYVLVGIGLNANFETKQIDAIRGIAVSLQDSIGYPIRREPLIGSILNEMERMYDMLNSVGEEKILAQLRQVDWSHGKDVRIKMDNREVIGEFYDFETLSKVRILTPLGLQTIKTDAVISVEYESN